MIRPVLILVLISVALAQQLPCPNQCKKGSKASKECVYFPHCHVQSCSFHKKGKKCTETPKPKPRCPDVCKVKHIAKLDCQDLLGYCKLKKCKYSDAHSHKKKKGLTCTKKFTKPTPRPTIPPHLPPLPVCNEICTDYSTASLYCHGLHHQCEVKACSHGIFRCTVKTAPTPGPHVCPVCPTGEYRAPGPGCRCVNKACDACPNGTVCRKMESFTRRTFLEDATVRSFSSYSFICLSCDCGYCDAQARACCTQVGSNCVQSSAALYGQCDYYDFRVYAGGATNVCTPNEVLLYDTGNKLVQTCGCAPSDFKECVVERNFQEHNCRVPRGPPL